MSSGRGPSPAGDAGRVRSDSAVREWERRGQLPLFAASMLYLAAYAVLVLDSGLSPGWGRFWWVVMTVAWVAFGVDFVVRVGLTVDRRRFLRRHWLDVVILALPLLRPLRVVQVYAATRARRDTRLSLEGQVMLHAGLTTLLLGFSASLTVYHDEHLARGANIRTFGDAVWWACSTLATVGFGDVYPVTVRGRVVGVVVMTVGVCLLGAVIATFSTWLVQTFERTDKDLAPGRSDGDGT